MVVAPGLYRNERAFLQYLIETPFFFSGIDGGLLPLAWAVAWRGSPPPRGLFQPAGRPAATGATRSSCCPRSTTILSLCSALFAFRDRSSAGASSRCWGASGIVHSQQLMRQVGVTSRSALRDRGLRADAARRASANASPCGALPASLWRLDLGGGELVEKKAAADKARAAARHAPSGRIGIVVSFGRFARQW